MRHFVFIPISLFLLPSTHSHSFSIWQIIGGEKRPIWFVFSGMGSQWNGMGKGLLDIPVFSQAVDRCDKVLRPRGIDIYHILTSDDHTLFNNIVHAFVGIITIQVRHPLGSSVALNFCFNTYTAHLVDRHMRIFLLWIQYMLYSVYYHLWSTHLHYVQSDSCKAYYIPKLNQAKLGKVNQSQATRILQSIHTEAHSYTVNFLASYLIYTLFFKNDS